MLVRLGWPDCDYIDRQPGGLPQDAYWVECSADEGLPLLAARTDNPTVPLETLGWGRTTIYPIDHQRFCFLITRDGSSIVPSRVVGAPRLWSPLHPSQTGPKKSVCSSARSQASLLDAARNSLSSADLRTPVAARQAHPYRPIS
jgi:hypothetical protein